MSASACACIAFNFKKKYKKKTNRWGFYTKLKLFLNAKKKQNLNPKTTTSNRNIK